MTLAATVDLVASAAAENTAVLAFNVITSEHAEGIADDAEAANPRKYLAAGRQAIGDTAVDLRRAVASASPVTVDVGERDVR